MALITCKDLAVGYDGEAVAAGLTFSVSAGDYLCIVGENGSGKSTLIRTLLHLQQPVSGEITLGDGLAPTEIGYLPQQSSIQKDFPASVREIVLSGCQGRKGIRPFYNAAERELANQTMEKLGILQFSKRCFPELSGGQQQRVLLARALCATRKVLLMDEPTAGLDPKVTADLYSLIDGLHREGITIIMISHDIAAAVRYASHILHIGRTVFFGTTERYRVSGVGRSFLVQEQASGSAEDDNG
ncbi:MAG: metal ABC transporter ATP-binding protein [Lachnospiraceae bacterium]|nr:metal ABC transporter ATP-binding protein [Lachnospiraceae bacterium]